MLQYNPTVSGSLTVTGTIQATQGITGSFSGSIAGLPTDTLAFSSSLSTRITATESTSSAYVTTSGSLASRVSLTETTASQFVTASGSLAARLTTDGTSIASINAKTGSFATTGSNYFIGNQVITGSVYIANDLVVQGSSSLQNITASAVSIGTNTVILNTNTPILQFGGISVYDSGSSQGRSGSLFWDSLADHWINVNPSGSDEGYNSAMVINGPKNTGSLGNEAGLTTFYVPRSQGEDHIEDSNIFSSASLVGIGTSVPSVALDIVGASNTTSRGRYAKTGEGILQLGANRSTSNVPYIGSENAYDFAFITNDTERMRIASGSGNVGIGITNPASKLEVIGVGSFNNNTSSRKWLLNAGDGVIQHNFNGTVETQIGFNGGTTFFLGQNVGIGTTSPSAQTEIRVNTNDYGNNLLLSNTYPASGIATSISFGHNTQAADPDIMARISGYVDDRTSGNRLGSLRFYTGNAGTVSERMRITSGGSVGIGTTNPSQKVEVWANSSDNALKIKNISSTGTARIIINPEGAGAGSTGDGVIFFDCNSSSWTMGVDKSQNSIFKIANDPYSDFTQNNYFNITTAGNIGIGTTSPLQTSSNRIVTTINGTTSAVLNLSTGGTLRSYLYADSSGSTFETVGTNTIAANSTNMISFTTNGTERMKIMSSGAVGTGQSANGTSLRATLVKQGTTSITFSMSLNTIGAWRPGHATIRVSGGQNGLQEYWSAWFIYRITGYFGSGTSITLLSSGGDTGAVGVSSSSDQNSPQAFSITLTDGGTTTDTMIADIDVAYHEGIISLT